MNHLVIVGNLTRDPETRTTGNGQTVCTFGVAVNRRKKVEGQPEADFFRVNAWGKIGETCQKYLAKGREVGVVGTVSLNTYQGNDGQTRASLEVFAQDVEFLSPSGGAVPAEASAPAAPIDVTAEVGGELPF